MTRIKKQLTIVFLAVFLLIRLSPAYCQAQFLPSFAVRSSILTVKFFRTVSQENFILSVERGIIDTDKFKAIPQIKFSGMLFMLAFAGTFLVCTSRYKVKCNLSYAPQYADKYILLGALRV